MKMEVTLLFILFVAIRGSHCFDINDPATNLDYFVRSGGNKNPNISTVAYFNGSIFGRQPHQPLAKLMNFEGYNINRKVWTSKGKEGYISLSLEFCVYRDPITMEILKVFINPMTSKPNEVIYVANDPVNGMLTLGDIIPAQILPTGVVEFNLDIVLEYPNALDPLYYSNYSAGTVYDAAELFSYFSNVTLLSTVKDVSVGFTGTWFRKSQYLPWMEMGTTPGNLFYSTLAWTCTDGIACIPDDILAIVTQQYPAFMDAPKTYEVPNETSWTQFKKIIDSRRHRGQPEIMIPEVDTVNNASTHRTTIDSRVMNFFLKKQSLHILFNGTAYSEITGKQPIKLFRFEGDAFISVTKPTTGSSFQVFAEGTGNYRDPVTFDILSTWTNPCTNTSLNVPPIVFSSITNIPFDFAYTVDMPSRNSVGLIAAYGTYSGKNTRSDNENWSVSFVDLIFEYAMLDKQTSGTFVYGSWGMFTNWLQWMEMDDTDGNLVMKATTYYRI